MPWPGDVGRRPVDGLEHGGELALGVEVRRRGDADRAGGAGGEVGEDVAEEVRADDDVEAAGLHDDLRAERVDVLLAHLHIRVARGHLAHDLVPERQRVDDAVGLRGAVRPPAAPLGQLERVLGDARRRRGA